MELYGVKKSPQACLPSHPLNFKAQVGYGAISSEFGSSVQCSAVH